MIRKMSDNFFIKVFFLGALWNICLGLAGILFYDLTITLFFGAEAVSHDLVSSLFYRLFMAAIIIFGIGYYIVSRDLSRNRAVLWLGLAGKITLFIVFTVLFVTGNATILAILTLTGDLAWSILFLLFLWQTKDTVTKNSIIG